ncbi:uncharacterized protein LOC112575045 [Pomacea canaliculata]|uniref:uncharacterized protein LOC112575045 n=1 Tax=Pomacea canaliculata TaxID=400727 RepID=UPI000D73B36E|nr:uncharacterized protein LOC112575045 [Pomacea canaliculata]
MVTVVCLVTCSAACLLLALSSATVDAQTYHYSNGWHPGKKRSDIPSATFDVTGGLRKEPCTFRPEVMQGISLLIQKEIARLQRSCVRDTSVTFKDILQTALLRQGADQTLLKNKLEEEDEDSGKW